MYAVFVVAVLAGFLAAGCGASRTSGAPNDQLAALKVSGDAARGYEREAFGPAWADVNRNGCDTRNDILNRDLAHKEWRPGTRQCVVVAGDLADPYSGVPLQFRKADAAAVQIDHVVALADAWARGAAAWSDVRRREFANDPLNLLAVDGRQNQAKGDANAAEWLPPRREARCAYAVRLVAVKAKYQLSVTAPEHDALASVLAAC